MICIKGPMTLCNEAHFAYTSGGQAQLTLTAESALPGGPHGAAYKLIWLGAPAAAFFSDYGHALKLGASLQVQAFDPRPLIDRGEPCVMATVLDIQITKQGTHPVTKAQPLSRWVALEGVTA